MHKKRIDIFHSVFWLILLMYILTNCSPQTTAPEGKSGEASIQESNISQENAQQEFQPENAHPEAGPPEDRTSSESKSTTEIPGIGDSKELPQPPDSSTPEKSVSEFTPESTPTEAPRPDHPTPPPGDKMPIGIPAPSFGLKETFKMYQGKSGYKTSTTGPYTHYVDNTHPNCSDKQSHGSPSKPLCDLFKGGRTVTLPAGSVVEIHGGPYKYDAWRQITGNGTAQRPIFIRGANAAKRIRFESRGTRFQQRVAGAYTIIENIEFYNKSHVSTEKNPHHLAFRNLEIHNAKNVMVTYGSALSWAGNDIVVSKCHIHHNTRTRNGKVDDLHGITIGQGSRRAWILDNHIHHNSGDSFQACHYCKNYPQFVYIGRNVFHEDRENAVDLKTIHDVVVSENLMYGYKGSSSSGGDAVVIGSNGFEKGFGPTRVLFIANTIRDSARGIRVEGAGIAHIIGNFIYNVTQGIQLDKNATRLSIINNTIANTKDGFYHAWRCNFPHIDLVNNIFYNSSSTHISIYKCVSEKTFAYNNLFANKNGLAYLKIGKASHSGKDSQALNTFFTMHFKQGRDNLASDPQFAKTNSAAIKATSPAVNRGMLSPFYAQYLKDHKIDLRFDLTKTPRPQKGKWDIGAFELK